MTQRVSSPKKKNSVINYSPSCRSKPVRPSFIFITQMKIFWWIPRALWPPIDRNVINMINVQKHSKEISKIIHVTSGVQPSFYKATKILFVCKENRNDDFIQQFVSSVSPRCHFREYPLHVNSIRCSVSAAPCCFCSNQSVNNVENLSAKWRLNPWCHMYYFTDLLAMFLDVGRVNYIAVYRRSESSPNASEIY